MAGLSDNLRGSLLMIGAMAGFTINDACMKAVAADLPLFQAMFLRAIATTLLLLVLARITGGLRFRLPPRDWVLILVRNGAEIGSAYFFVTAIFNMPLANATAIMQALPLTITLAGALFFREAVGWRRLSAIMLGLVGVLLIVRPGAEGFTIYSLYALAAVALVTLRDLLARGLSRDVPTMTVAFVNAVLVTVFFGAGSVFVEWAPVSSRSVLLLIAAGGLLVGGYVFSVSAMRVGELAVVSPFRYTSLLWALLLGWVLFGDWPAPPTLLGAGIVVATGVYTFYRERALARPAPKALRIR